MRISLLHLHAIPVQLGCWPNLFGAFFPGSKYNSPTVLTNTQTRGNVHLMITVTIPTFVDYVQNVKKSVHAFRVGDCGMAKSSEPIKWQDSNTPTTTPYKAFSGALLL